MQKGLKLLRAEFRTTRYKTEPTPGSITQKKKLNKDAHRNGPHSKHKGRK